MHTLVRRSGLVATLVCSMSAHSRQPADDGARAVEGEVRTASTLRSLVQLPEGYADELASTWPLVLFLHGAGERGDDLELVEVWGPPRMMAEGDLLPAVVLSPQCPADEWRETKALLALLDAVESEYRIDASRVYVTGISMGGYGTWDLGVAAPERFAALAPVCGGASGPLRRRERLVGVPVWAFHGSEDAVVSLLESVEAVDAVRRAGGTAKITVYEGVGHDSWRRAYAEEEFWAWLFAQRRK